MTPTEPGPTVQAGSAAAVAPEPAPDPVQAAFQSFLRSLRARALASGVTPATFDAVTPTLVYDPRVVRLDRAQPGAGSSSASPPLAPYIAQHVDANRISRGRATRARHGYSLSQAERSGVAAGVVLAIWGHETDYGGFTGGFDLPRSLASLAYEGRRRELFTAEFIDTLKLIDRGTPRERLKGSWAGATGYPQFLPSVYLRLARDGDGDGRADIWTSGPDAIASIAAYLGDAGWKPGVRWGTEVSVPAALDRAAIATRLSTPRCPRVFARHSRWLTVAEWKALGIAQAGGPWPDDNELATLFEPDGPNGRAWLLTANYRPILDYNCSNFYALSVGLLADAVVN